MFKTIVQLILYNILVETPILFIIVIIIQNS